MPDRSTLDYNGQLHGHLAAQVNEDLSKVKEFRSQNNSVFEEKKQARPTIKRPSTAKNKGNLNNPDVDMIEKIEREKQQHQVKSFPLKK